MASQNPTPRKDPGSTIRQIAVAFEMPFMVVAPVLLGGGIGYLLDRWLHTKPLLMLVLGVAGVVLGIRDALKAASAGDQRNGG